MNDYAFMHLSKPYRRKRSIFMGKRDQGCVRFLLIKKFQIPYTMEVNSCWSAKNTAKKLVVRGGHFIQNASLLCEAKDRGYRVNNFDRTR